MYWQLCPIWTFALSAKPSLQPAGLKTSIPSGSQAASQSNYWIYFNLEVIGKPLCCEGTSSDAKAINQLKFSWPRTNNFSASSFYPLPLISFLSRSLSHRHTWTMAVFCMLSRHKPQRMSQCLHTVGYKSRSQWNQWLTGSCWDGRGCHRQTEELGVYENPTSLLLVSSS